MSTLPITLPVLHTPYYPCWAQNSTHTAEPCISGLVAKSPEIEPMRRLRGLRLFVLSRVGNRIYTNILADAGVINIVYIHKYMGV